MEDVPNTIRPESQPTIRSSPFRDGICLHCDLREGAWGKKGDVQRDLKQIGKFQRLSPAVRPWSLPFLKPQQAVKYHLRGCLSARQSPIPIPQIWGHQR